MGWGKRENARAARVVDVVELALFPLSHVAGQLAVVQVLSLRPLLLLAHPALDKEDRRDDDEQN